MRVIRRSWDKEIQSVDISFQKNGLSYAVAPWGVTLPSHIVRFIWNFKITARSGRFTPHGVGLDEVITSGYEENYDNSGSDQSSVPIRLYQCDNPQKPLIKHHDHD